MAIQDFFKKDDIATYHLEFVPENETVFVLKRLQSGKVQTAVFSFQTAMMHTKQLLLILKESDSDASKTVWFSVLPFNDYMLITDPTDVDPEQLHNSEGKGSENTWPWLFMTMCMLLNTKSDCTNPMTPDQK